MESGTPARPSKALLLCGILGALLLAQGAACLRCYSCSDANDGGCAADLIEIEDCAPPRNVCLEAFHAVTLDSQTLSVAIKGCDVGTKTSIGFESGTPNPSALTKSISRSCSEDLCNKQVIGDFIKRPDNGNKPSVPRDNECYSCFSTSQDQCSDTKAAVVKCHGDEEVCYNESSTVTLGNLDTFTVPYFIKKCSKDACYGIPIIRTAAFLKHYQSGSCCRGNLCNGVLPVPRSTAPPNTGLRATPPNTGLRPTICVAHLILAAILAITSL